MSQLDSPFLFYAAEISYFSGKVRPALRYKRVPYAEVLCTAQAMREVILARTGLAFIPIVVTPENETWQDTSDILDALEARFPAPPLLPETPLQRVTALLWEIYADEFLILPAMHYRWSTPEGSTKARGDFAANSGDVRSSQNFADRMSGSLRALGVLPETLAVIEAHTFDLLDRLEAHFAQTPFLLGDAPSLADCALMGPFYAHLFLDAVPGRLLRERAPRTCHWIMRMNSPDPSARGTWLADDALAPTMRPLLELIGRDAVPLLLDGLRDFETWADGRPEAHQVSPPRASGFHRTSLRGVEFPRYTNAYALWLATRLFDAVAALDTTARAQVDTAFAGTGCAALIDYQPRHRLRKQNFQLVFEDARAKTA